ncbi:MAG TPA: hypothetical protein VE547_08915 [Mycobacteriales bacterium]|nr:hypothetical protein [Mycobacteriales bacterium]
MVLLPGGEGRRDPERAEAARRQRVRFARDIGDERALGWAHEPPRPRGRFTRATFVALALFAGLGAVPLLTSGGSDGLLPADCGTPALSTSPAQVGPGGSFAYQFAGPAEGRYVVTLDTPEVLDDGTGGARVAGGRLLGQPVSLPGCRSAHLLADAPGVTGTHEVSLFRRSGTRWERVAVSLLRVS